MNTPATIGTLERLEEKRSQALNRHNRILDFDCLPPDYEPTACRRKRNAHRWRRLSHYLRQYHRFDARADTIVRRVFAAGLEGRVFPGVYAAARNHIPTNP